MATNFFSSFNPFPSPCVTTDDIKWFQCINKLIGKTKLEHYFWVSIDANSYFHILDHQGNTIKKKKN